LVGDCADAAPREEHSVTTDSVTLRSAVLPRFDGSRSAVLTDAAVVTGAAGLIAASAQVVVHTGLTPVPFTLQTFAVLVTGAALGSLRGVLSMGLYLLVGMAGAPVFADGRSGTLWNSPSGGYLVGMLLAAALTGYLAEHRWHHRVAPAVTAMLLGNVVVFTVGTVWLAAVLDVGAGKAVALGVTPFVWAEVAKLVAAGLVLPGAWGVLRRVRG
jgi:biotin transport system substrate-specific component